MVKSWNIWEFYFIINSFEIRWNNNYCSGEQYVAHGPLVFYLFTWIYFVTLFEDYFIKNIGWNRMSFSENSVGGGGGGLVGKYLCLQII